MAGVKGIEEILLGVPALGSGGQIKLPRYQEIDEQEQDARGDQ